MVEPQRGQIDPEHWQVVPQLEQVDTRPQQPDVGCVPGQETVLPLNVVVAPAAASLPTSSKAQLDCGKSGSEKNSSQTDSANSSAGGISQKP